MESHVLVSGLSGGCFDDEQTLMFCQRADSHVLVSRLSALAGLALVGIKQLIWAIAWVVEI